MKILCTGGQKSGKSRFAEAKTLEFSSSKPYYLATSEIFDHEFAKRVEIHKKQRADRFISIEEPLNIVNKVKNLEKPVLIECLTLWINNMIYYNKESEIFTEIERLLNLPNTIIMVLNDVGLGIIPNSEIARKFVDISGRVGQLIASKSDEVYYTTVGITKQLK